MLCLFGCSSQNIKTYQHNSPKFDIRKYFNGNLEAYGILQNWQGKVIRTFTVKMQATWQEDKGVLQEYFLFNDGEKQERVWQLNMQDDHNFTAIAADVVKTAKGQQYGNAVKMDYVLAIPVGDKTYNFTINDWLFLIDENSLVNVSTITKFGIPVAKLSIGFKKI
jgi:hypothetical protein